MPRPCCRRTRTSGWWASTVTGSRWRRQPPASLASAIGPEWCTPGSISSTWCSASSGSATGRLSPPGWWGPCSTSASVRRSSTEAERGFSYRFDAPLDMRMDRDQPLTAADVLNTVDEGDLARLLRDYGDEPHAAPHRPGRRRRPPADDHRPSWPRSSAAPCPPPPAAAAAIRPSASSRPCASPSTPSSTSSPAPRRRHRPAPARRPARRPRLPLRRGPHRQGAPARTPRPAAAPARPGCRACAGPSPSFRLLWRGAHNPSAGRGRRQPQSRERPPARRREADGGALMAPPTGPGAAAVGDAIRSVIELAPASPRQRPPQLSHRPAQPATAARPHRHRGDLLVFGTLFVLAAMQAGAGPGPAPARPRSTTTSRPARRPSTSWPPRSPRCEAPDRIQRAAAEFGMVQPPDVVFLAPTAVESSRPIRPRPRAAPSTADAGTADAPATTAPTEAPGGHRPRRVRGGA